MTAFEQLEDLHRQVEELNDEIPKELARKITLNTLIMHKYGEMHAAATYDFGKFYAKRKKKWGETVVSSEGTALVKEGNAETACFPYRMAESKAESEMTKWKNAFIAQGELIQAQKLELKLLIKEMGIDT